MVSNLQRFIGFTILMGLVLAALTGCGSSDSSFIASDNLKTESDTLSVQEKKAYCLCVKKKSWRVMFI